MGPNEGSVDALHGLLTPPTTMIRRLRLPALFVSAPMQDTPVRVAVVTALAALASVVAVLAL